MQENTAKPLPSRTQVGMPQIRLSQDTLDNYSLFWRKRNDGKVAKCAMLLKAISNNPGIKTNEARKLADDCSNVPNLVSNINKKIMNKGLMIIRIDPINVAPNEDFHHWYLVEAPIMQVSVGMAVNDPKQ